MPETILISENDFGFSEFIFVQDAFDQSPVTLTLGGIDAAFFSLDPFSAFDFASGSLELLAPLDFENPLDADGDNVYEIELSASDGVNVTTQTILVTVEDAFESANAPVFTTPDTVSVDEGESFVINVNADDADGDIPTYSITGGEDQFSFFINETTGEIGFFGPVSFNQPDDFEDNTYTIEVTANDQTGNQTTQVLTIDVVDIDLAPSINLFGPQNSILCLLYTSPSPRD